ncbi:MAG TPA: RluA family pseudouridine synthase, partial [Clostridiales bacterium]|nr:RluA family pseudouridine synthase [Clostridiales bacterium]
IRVHMKELGNSIAGDKKYGATTNPLKRLALHAYKLEVTHPFTDEMLTFETKVPKGFNGLIDK